MPYPWFADAPLGDAIALAAWVATIELPRRAVVASAIMRFRNFIGLEYLAMMGVLVKHPLFAERRRRGQAIL